MKNYQKVNVPAGEARVELHDSLNLTGAEVVYKWTTDGGLKACDHILFAWLRQENANCRLRQTAPLV